MQRRRRYGSGQGLDHPALSPQNIANQLRSMGIPPQLCDAILSGQNAADCLTSACDDAGPCDYFGFGTKTDLPNQTSGWDSSAATGVILAGTTSSWTQKSWIKPFTIKQMKVASEIADFFIVTELSIDGYQPSPQTPLDLPASTISEVSEDLFVTTKGLDKTSTLKLTVQNVDTAAHPFRMSFLGLTPTAR